MCFVLRAGEGAGRGAEQGQWSRGSVRVRGAAEQEGGEGLGQIWGEGTSLTGLTPL